MFDCEKAKRLIDERGLRRGFVAGKVGLQHSTLNWYLCGRGSPSLRVLEELASLLGVRPSDLQGKPKAKAG